MRSDPAKRPTAPTQLQTGRDLIAVSAIIAACPDSADTLDAGLHGGAGPAHMRRCGVTDIRSRYDMRNFFLIMCALTVLFIFFAVFKGRLFK